MKTLIAIALLEKTITIERINEISDSVVSLASDPNTVTEDVTLTIAEVMVKSINILDK